MLSAAAVVTARRRFCASSSSAGITSGVVSSSARAAAESPCCRRGATATADAAVVRKQQQPYVTTSTSTKARSTRSSGGQFPLLSRAGRTAHHQRMMSTSAPAAGGGERSVAAAASKRRPIQKATTPQERAELRAARKERAARTLQMQQQGGGDAAAVSAEGAGGAAAVAATSTSSKTPSSLAMSRWMWYVGLGLPTAIIVWGVQDENSPPAKLSNMIGLTGLISSWTDNFAKPSFDKLLPDWSQMPQVPQDIPVPPTLVLDLENTLVSSTWERKYGWRHAKRPGVDKFLHELAQYYEIVLYSPSIDGLAEPVVNSLDKDGCILHRLYRDATHYHKGVHVKDLKRLNRNLKRVIVIDDDPDEVQFNLGNMIRVKPYTDPNDRTDNTLLRILPFLVEVAREGYDDIPELLSQYRGMDADEIADEQDRRISELREYRLRQRSGLGGFARGGMNLPEPELPPANELLSSSYSSTSPQQLTAKDIAGKAPTDDASSKAGLVAWMQRRAKEKEEHQMRKIEKWNEVMMKKQQQRREDEERQADA